jgi:hypothetical protein
MKCKEYKIPTNSWLRPLEILVDEYNSQNSDRIIIDSEILENEIKRERVIVKVIKNNTYINTNKELYSIIKTSTHVSKIYCFINCSESKTALTNNYKDMIGFCNGNHLDKDDQFVTIEVMRRYESSLNKYEGKMNLKNMIYSLKYLLLIQLELFESYGFVHNDMHLGNILIKKLDNQTTTINFIYDNNEIKFDTKIMFYLNDFDYSLILFDRYNRSIKDFLKKPNNRKYDYTLESNIYNTFYHCINLLDDEKKKTKLYHLLANGKIDKYSRELYYDKTMRNFNMFCSGEKPEINFIRITKILASDIISNLFKLLFKQSFI